MTIEQECRSEYSNKCPIELQIDKSLQMAFNDKIKKMCFFKVTVTNLYRVGWGLLIHKLNIWDFIITPINIANVDS